MIRAGGKSSEPAAKSTWRDAPPMERVCVEAICSLRHGGPWLNAEMLAAKSHAAAQRRVEIQFDQSILQDQLIGREWTIMRTLFRAAVIEASGMSAGLFAGEDIELFDLRWDGEQCVCVSHERLGDFTVQMGVAGGFIG